VTPSVTAPGDTNLSDAAGLLCYQPQRGVHGNGSGIAVYVCNTITFESLGEKSSFLVC